MPLFNYTALLLDGTTVTGQAMAASKSALTEELASRRILVQSISQGSSRFAIGAGRAQPKPAAMLVFIQEFVALLRAGLTIPECLQLVADRPSELAFSRVLQAMLDDVLKGKSLSATCEQYPDIWDGLFLSAVRTGERTGDLVSALGHYVEFLRRRVAMQRKIVQALTYPLFLLIALAVILVVLFVVVLPRFVQLYADMDAELPFATGVLIGIVKNFELYLGLGLLLGVAVWFALRQLKQNPEAQYKFDRFKLAVPLFGPMARTAQVSQMARTLSMLLAGGTPLVEALRATASSLSNREQARRLEEATARIMGGSRLAAAFEAEDLMPKPALKMVMVGEASGALDVMLAEVGQFYDEQLEHVLTRVMSTVEPALMLLVGTLVGGVIIIMYLPIFRIAEVIQ
jgi:type IV pilus assembly protein PilC